jgi:pimeloyl-ACP methyl ester carboxylesterase
VGDADVAYQVFGEGSTDLVYVWGLGSHVEMGWESPTEARFRRRLASFARVIMLDRRGTGASDGVTRGAIPTWEDWTEDILSVVDEVGSNEFSVLAEVDAGPIGILFSALHPERVRSLILANTFCRALVDHDFPIGLTPKGVEAIVAFVGEHWGTTELAAQPNRTWLVIPSSCDGWPDPREPQRLRVRRPHSTDTSSMSMSVTRFR